jgi:hypothetical protein
MRHLHQDAKRTAYYRQQASACETAARATAIAEVRQAYLDLEQGWLCLALKVEENSAVLTFPNTADDADLQVGRTSSGNVSPDMTDSGHS